MGQAKSEIRDNMQIDWDVAVAMDDGVVLRADVFRPVGGGKCTVILSYGPYAKGLSFQEGYPSQWGAIRMPRRSRMRHRPIRRTRNRTKSGIADFRFQIVD